MASIDDLVIKLDAAVLQNVADLRARLAAALWENRRLRRELAALRPLGDSGGPGGFLIRTYDATIANPPYVTPAAVTNWLDENGNIHWSEDNG